MAKHPVRKLDSLDAMESELRTRLRECEGYINANHKVASVCFSYPDRVAALKKARGERLRGCCAAHARRGAAADDAPVLAPAHPPPRQQKAV